MADAASLDSLPSDIRWMQLAAPVLAGLAALLMLTAGALWLGKRPVFEWRQIRIEGDVERNSLATLRANAMPHLEGNFLSMNLARARAAFEAAPWVRRATVQRVWPGQLRVVLEEHRAVALWDGRGDWGEPAPERALLNSHGEVFQANLGDVEDDGLPQFSGPHGSAPQVMRLWQRLQGLSQSLGETVVKLELSGRGSWRLAWESGALKSSWGAAAKTNCWTATASSCPMRWPWPSAFRPRWPRPTCAMSTATRCDWPESAPPQ